MVVLYSPRDLINVHQLECWTCELMLVIHSIATMNLITHILLLAHIITDKICIVHYITSESNTVQDEVLARIIFDETQPKITLAD